MKTLKPYRPSLAVLVLALAPALLVLSVVLAAKLLGVLKFDNVMHDLAAIVNVHPFSGSVSRLGVIAWAAAAAVSLFAALCVHRLGQRGTAFLVSAGLLSLMLLADDAFMIHDKLAEAVLGPDEKLSQAVIVLVVISWVIAFRRSIAEVGPFFLMMAFGLLGCSLFMDLFIEGIDAPEYLHDWESFLEDGPKFMGITIWVAFHVQAALHFVNAPASARERTARKAQNRGPSKAHATA